MRFFLRRLFTTLLVLLGVSTIVFFLAHLSGDPAELMLPQEATPEQVEAFRHAMGFDQPLLEQYLRFMERAIQGDFGISLRHKQPAMMLVLERLPATIQLAAAGMAIALVIALPLGIIAALNRNSLIDLFASFLAMAGQSMPTFWLGILLILFFAVELRWLPASGIGDWRSLILPAFTLGAFSAALITRILRSSMLEILNKEFIRTARSKGLRERRILFVHVMRNAAIPVIAVVALQTGNLMGGAVVTETVFAYPGMSLLAVQAIYNRDFPVVQAYVVVVAIIITLMNVIADLMYRIIDPRVSLE